VGRVVVVPFFFIHFFFCSNPIPERRKELGLRRAKLGLRPRFAWKNQVFEKIFKSRNKIPAAGVGVPVVCVYWLQVVGLVQKDRLSHGTTAFEQSLTLLYDSQSEHPTHNQNKTVFKFSLESKFCWRYNDYDTKLNNFLEKKILITDKANFIENFVFHHTLSWFWW